MTTYRWHINLHERGEFYADARDPTTGDSVWELRTEQAIELLEDGLIRNPCDATDVGAYLHSVGVLRAGDDLIPAF